jgi:hypothetical protein
VPREGYAPSSPVCRTGALLLDERGEDGAPDSLSLPRRVMTPPPEVIHRGLRWKRGRELNPLR